MLAWLLLQQTAVQDFDFDVSSQLGLTISAKGIPLLRGSGFQYYAPGWKKGYYSSRWKVQTVRRIDDNTYEMKFDEGGAFGNAKFQRQGNRLVVDYEFNWKNDEAALIELNEGMVWLPPFQNGNITLDGVTRTLPQLPPVGGLEQRLLGKAASDTVLSGVVAKISLKSSEAASTFDGRKYDQEWAEKAPVYWQGVLALPIVKGEAKKVHVEYLVEVRDRTTADAKKITLPPMTIKNAVQPDEGVPPLIPNPKMSILDYTNTLTITNLWKLPAGRPKFFDLFRAELERRFELPVAGSLPDRISFDGGMSDFKKTEGTYHLKITKDSISVYGQEAMGLRNGIYRLLQLAFIKDGKLCLPTGVIEDEPRSDFRGVHLFVGPKSLEFQQKLWTNVLRPLGFNKVVLQCERTEWKSLPNLRGGINMKQEDLVKLFNWYRTQEVEPIPLIQSFGHMEWFFAGAANRQLAYNPQDPYAIDPRKPEAKELVGKVWDEAVQVLRPKTIHFGLDEVDMTGFGKRNPAETTEMWTTLLPYLGSVAKRNNVKMMLWGDEGLAPGEAVDATNGDDAENALARRKAIPKGSFIADWHYRADTSHTPFLKSLQTWKVNGQIPIATSWYRPENIRGFYVAADLERVGTLQTTWAGYESSEENMLSELKQFSAMVLAGDYGWSGRLERPDELPYDPMKVFAKMYSPHQSPLTPSDAAVVGRGDLFDCGGIKFSKLEDSSLIGITPQNVNAPLSLELGLSGFAREIAVAVACDIEAASSEKVGEITIAYKDGTQERTPIQYGLHVRAASDDQATFFGERTKDRTCLRLTTKPLEVKSITFNALNRYTGLRVDGVTLLPLKNKPRS